MAQVLSYQSSAILHAAILGAFKARGTSFEAWCAQNNLHPASMRNVAYGQSKGAAGRLMLARLIKAAGPEVVQAAYLARLKAHVAELKAGAA